MTFAAHSPIEIRRSQPRLAVLLVKIGRVYRSWRAARRNRQLAAELSDAQLADAGLARAELAGNKPVIQVPPGTMARLMSMC